MEFDLLVVFISVKLEFFCYKNSGYESSFKVPKGPVLKSLFLNLYSGVGCTSVVFISCIRSPKLSFVFFKSVCDAIVKSSRELRC